MRRIASFITTNLLLLIALVSPVSAHPGHDHSHWLSPAMHSVYFISILLLSACLAWGAVLLFKKVTVNRKGK
ncbi:hypothetical protein [Sessilibacter corallicola]|uniref:hypothetical protein n=1 Tax=Sessilibacter corallicola TaxID=2904075 RepID=UPI001E4D3A31|nr:hypothetical protein [Sessilibacter corallicola]MCE2029844.1 hypothetical protein [Sessilibacter corallicola]